MGSKRCSAVNMVTVDNKSGRMLGIRRPQKTRKENVMKNLTKAALFLSLLIVAACGSTSQKVGDYELSNDASGLVADDSIAPALLFVRPNAPDLSTFDRFIVDPVSVRYDDPSVEKLSDSDLARMQNYFRDQVTSELRAAGKEVTTEPGENTMRISFTLSGIKAPSAVPNAAGVLVATSFSVGEVTIEAAFSDAELDEINAIVVDRSRGARFMNATPWSTWAEVESSCDYWARGIGTAVKP